MRVCENREGKARDLVFPVARDNERVRTSGTPDERAVTDPWAPASRVRYRIFALANN